MPGINRAAERLTGISADRAIGKKLPAALPLADVQWILGHAHLTTTQIYMNPSVDEAVAALRAHHARQARAGNDPAPPAPGYDPRSLDVLFGRQP